MRNVRRRDLRGKAWTAYSRLGLGYLVSCGFRRIFIGYRFGVVRHGRFSVLLSSQILQFHRSVAGHAPVRQIRVNRSERASSSFQGRTGQFRIN